jgi:urease accessory protein
MDMHVTSLSNQNRHGRVRPLAAASPSSLCLHPDMKSPFPASSSRPGDGRVVARRHPNGTTALESITYQYPLKLVSPTSSARETALVFLLSYGGGLVGGDRVNLDVDVLDGARLSIVTQGHTKIFNSPTPDLVTRQTLRVNIRGTGAFCLLPDPVQPFQDSVYEQTQVFRVDQEASACLLDWVTQGRAARGENWSLTSWKGRNEVWQISGEPRRDGSSSKDRLLVRDSVVLSREDPLPLGKPLKDVMHELGVFGTLILRGSLMESLGEFLLAEFAAMPRIGARDFRTAEDRAQEDGDLSEPMLWRLRRLELEKKEKLLWSAARVRGCVIVKFGAATVEGGRLWIGSVLEREGSISKLFGDEALICVR